MKKEGIWKGKEITDALGIEPCEAGDICGVSIDSRTINEGELFVALKGERVDGHHYIKDVLEKGIQWVLAERYPTGFENDARILLVDDTYKALNDLAVTARKRTKAKIIGVTGSVGKTGTKEALKLALQAVGKTYATQGNYNNHIGLPLSLVNMPANSEFGVFELGMNHPGEISYLARLVRPDISIITAVEAVHLEFFESVEKIADAKAEIFEGMSEAGIVLLNYDNRYFEQLERRAHEAGLSQIYSFGKNSNADFQMETYKSQLNGSDVTAKIKGESIRYKLGTIGCHWGLMSVATLATVNLLEKELKQAASALAEFNEPKGRGKLHHIPWESGYITLIDDSYNASPISVVSGIRKLTELYKAAGDKGRRIAVLGDMLELGLGAPELHINLKETLIEEGVEVVFTAGNLMRHLHENLPETLAKWHNETSQSLTTTVLDELKAGDIILVKGSHGSRMDIVVDALIENAQKKRHKQPLDATQEWADAV